MKKNEKISFLIAAHNEEKIINKTLESLIRLPYDNYEVILGLDGCTDRTEEIVKKFCNKSNKFRYYKLNLRQGKPTVINFIIKKASGKIIIIQDADWIFQVKNKKSLMDFISVFDNNQIGGIAESFPVQYPLKKNASILERGIMIQNKIWLDYLKEAGKKINSDWIMADKNSHPLLVNILRKDLYRPNKSLGDDFERFIDIIKVGKEVLATNNENLPRMISVGEKYRFNGLIRQKERTALARRQLDTNHLGRTLNSSKFYRYIIGKMLKMKPLDLLAFGIVNTAFIIGTLKSKLRKNVSTKEGWKMRLTR